MELRKSLAVSHNAKELGERDGPLTKSGHVIDGSWNPQQATVDVQIGVTIPYESPAFNDGLNQPMNVTCSIVGQFPYAQYGPVGGELVQVWEDDSDGWVCAFDNAIPDATPQASSGELIIPHRSAQNTGDTVTFDAALTFTNDGPTTGDKLGGALLGGGALSKVFTAGGWTFTLDDTHKLGTIESPGGVLIQIDDNAGKVYLGANGLGSGNAVMTEEDVANAFASFATILQTWAQTSFQSGSSSPPKPSAPTVTGSSTVFAKE